MSSLGNIAENGHIGLLFVGFCGDAMPDCMLEGLFQDGGRRPERWVGVDTVEAYVHCSKHIPHLVRREDNRTWGTDEVVRKVGDYFRAKHSSRPWADSIVPGPWPQPGAESAR